MSGACWHCAGWRPAGRDKLIIKVFNFIPRAMRSHGRALQLAMGLMSIYDSSRQYKKARTFVSGCGESGSCLGPLCTCTPGVWWPLTPLPSLAVRYFLKNKVSPDLCNEDGLTALHQVRPGWQGPPFPAPHLDRCPISLLFPAQNPQGGGREGEPQLPRLKGSCLLVCVCYKHAHRAPVHTHAATQPRRTGSLCPLHPRFPAKGLANKANLFVA